MRSLLGWPRFLPFAAMLALPALAQDAPPPPPAPPPAQPQVSGQEAPKAESSDRADRFGAIYAEVQVWGVRPSGTQFIPASVVSSDGSYSTNYRMGDDQRTSFLYQAGYWFRIRDWGGILGSYWDSNANDDSNVSSPGVCADQRTTIDDGDVEAFHGCKGSESEVVSRQSCSHELTSSYLPGNFKQCVVS